MTTLRVYKLGLTGAAPVVPIHLRIYKLGLTGSAPAPKKLRLYKLGLTGANAVVLNPFPTFGPIEPEKLVELTATLSGGGTGDLYTWRRVSGPPVTITPTGTGGTASFRAPSFMVNGVPTASTLVIGVRVTLNGVQSPEQTATISSPPQTRWWYTPTGFVGRRPIQWSFSTIPDPDAVIDAITDEI